MVRLKEPLFGYPPYCTSGFQFHYGAIKRVDGLPVVTNTLIFQFHYGAIKSILF